ncbi:MAG: RdgB/HAM1 family non-canonical purine NTP pyrophosphatase [Planctomycetota bacterium]
MFDLVLGTGNAKKLVELRMMLPSRDITLASLADVDGAIEVVEDGESFAENAAKKACQQALAINRWVLAEDSGLCVDALDGQPGIYSARYAGTHGDDEANNDKLLKALDGVPAQQRGAAFHCHLCLADPTGTVQCTEHGSCRGQIALERTGGAGFGYDPLFVIREYHRSFGELDLVVKRAISHRSRALRKFIPKLIAIVEANQTSD